LRLLDANVHVYREIMPRLSPLAHEYDVTGSSRPSGTAQGN
jgi:hypothetical protein